VFKRSTLGQNFDLTMGDQYIDCDVPGRIWVARK
jgi:hypothetical protein